MIIELNEVLHYLDQQKGEPRRYKSKHSLRLNLTIPSVRLDKIIKKLSRDGHINIFLHRVDDYVNISQTEWEKSISFDLSNRGKEFIKKGGYHYGIIEEIQMNSAVGF